MPILSEIATMTEVAQGTSLARFGHGELLIMAGENAEHQKYDERLCRELRAILHDSPCLFGAPPYDPPEWEGFLDKYGACLGLDDRLYGSSFVSRADWVPWTKEFRGLIQRLWKDRAVIVVAPDKIELEKTNIVIHVKTPGRNAFDIIDDLERQIAPPMTPWATEDIVILSCGPTATVLADRLTRKGIWAVDLGNFGKFL